MIIVLEFQLLCASETFYKKKSGALASMAQWVGVSQCNHRATDAIPSQGTCPGFGLHPWLGCVQEAAGECFSLTSICLSLPSSLKNENKINLKKLKVGKKFLLPSLPLTPQLFQAVSASLMLLQ